MVLGWVLLIVFKSYVGVSAFQLVHQSSASWLRCNLKYCQDHISDFLKSKQFMNSLQVSAGSYRNQKYISLKTSPVVSIVKVQ